MNNLNNMGMMNPFGMNNINNFGMNPLGMMNPIGINNQPNLMNEMNFDETAQNIKSIIQPYENKIRELEEIIKEKDFEITVLKQKLNKSNQNMMNLNMNQMMINMNGMNMMMPNMNNLNQNIKKEISINLNFEDNRTINVKCFEDDNISILKNKCNINKRYLAFDYQIISDDSTIKENRYSTIDVISQIKSITFKTDNGISRNVVLDGNCPIGIALIFFLIRFKIVNGIKRILDKYLVFLYNGSKIRFDDSTPIKDFFRDILYPVVIAINADNLIGS